MSMVLKRLAPSEYQSMSRHSLMCASIGCDRELAPHRSGTQKLQFHVPVDYELLRRWNPRETQKSLVQVVNGRQLCFEVFGVDSERLPLEVQAEYSAGDGHSEVIPFDVHAEHDEDVPTCLLWPRLFGAYASVTVRATVIHKAESWSPREA